MLAVHDPLTFLAISIYSESDDEVFPSVSHVCPPLVVYMTETVLLSVGPTNVNPVYAIPETAGDPHVSVPMSLYQLYVLLAFDGLGQTATALYVGAVPLMVSATKLSSGFSTQ